MRKGKELEFPEGRGSASRILMKGVPPKLRMLCYINMYY
jgi:hypothetical protein